MVQIIGELLIHYYITRSWRIFFDRLFDTFVASGLINVELTGSCIVSDALLIRRRSECRGCLIGNKTYSAIRTVDILIEYIGRAEWQNQISVVSIENVPALVVDI